MSVTGPVVEIRPKTSLVQTPVAKTADYAVLAADVNKIFTNTGASGTVKFTLPAVAEWPGKPIRFKVLAAQIVQVAPASGEKIYLDGDGVASKYVSLAATAGNVVSVFNNGTSVEVQEHVGVVRKEA